MKAHLLKRCRRKITITENKGRYTIHSLLRRRFVFGSLDTKLNKERAYKLYTDLVIEYAETLAQRYKVRN